MKVIVVDRIVGETFQTLLIRDVRKLIILIGLVIILTGLVVLNRLLLGQVRPIPLQTQAPNQNTKYLQV